MKGTVTIALAALLMTAAMPVFAAEEAQQREQCAISANTCLNKVDILEKRIKKMKAELKRCVVVHSPEEMKKLEQKLQDAIDQLDKIEGKK